LQWWQREPHSNGTSPHPAARHEADELLRALPPTLREAFLLRHLEELTYEEMAAVTGARISALKMRVKRATDLLAKRIRDDQSH
jgi:RNA polymerase sigma-70 factor (ECF subfamily)